MVLFVEKFPKVNVISKKGIAWSKIQFIIWQFYLIGKMHMNFPGHYFHPHVIVRYITDMFNTAFLDIVNDSKHILISCDNVTVKNGNS